MRGPIKLLGLTITEKLVIFIYCLNLFQAQELQPSSVKVNKKDGTKPESDASIEAELELLKLQSTLNQNSTAAGSELLNQNVMTNMHNYPEKPKRDTPLNITEIELLNNTTDVGQKELVYGHVNIDPVLFNTGNYTEGAAGTEETQKSNNATEILNSAPLKDTNIENINSATSEISSDKKTDQVSNSPTQILKKAGEQKLNPENDYSDIGEAIKLISRYADVTTDDNFAKEPNKYALKEDNILGTRTKLQYRRNKPKEPIDSAPVDVPLDLPYNDKTPAHDVYPSGVYYRYPWPSHAATPPPDYPFRHLQDYWPGRTQVGGVYNTHENPRRHHHSYPHNFRLHGYPHSSVGVPSAYPEQLKGYIHRVVQHHANPMRPHNNNQDLYSLLGLRHWFSSEGTSKR